MDPANNTEHNERTRTEQNGLLAEASTFGREFATGSAVLCCAVPCRAAVSARRAKRSANHNGAGEMALGAAYVDGDGGGDVDVAVAHRRETLEARPGLCQALLRRSYAAGAAHKLRRARLGTGLRGRSLRL